MFSKHAVRLAFPSLSLPPTAVELHNSFTLRWASRGYGKTTFRRLRLEHLEPLTDSQRHIARRLLSQDCPIYEIALAIERSEEAIKNALKVDKKLQAASKKIKKGRWSNIEDQLLLSLVKDMSVIDTENIADQMGRDRSSIRYRLRRMRDSGEYLGPASNANPPPFPQELLDGPVSEEEQTLIVQRLSRIIERVVKDGIPRVDEPWRSFLTSKSTAQWITILLPLIPTKIKHVLAASRSPTVADWESLDWEDADCMGVFAWVLKRRRVHPLRSTPFLCIQAATGHGNSSGLNSRKDLHQRRKDYGSFDVSIRAKGLWRKAGPYITLLSLDRASDHTWEDTTDTTYLVRFSEAIFSTYFGTLKGNGSSSSAAGSQQDTSSLHSLCPWNTEQLAYRGLLSPNRLVEKLGYMDQVQREERDMYWEKRRKETARLNTMMKRYGAEGY